MPKRPREASPESREIDPEFGYDRAYYDRWLPPGSVDGDWRRFEAVRLSKAGMNVSRIARRLNRGRDFVYRWVKRFAETSRVDDDERGGREVPRDPILDITVKEMVAFVIDECGSERCDTIASLQDLVETSFDRFVPRSTLRDALSELEVDTRLRPLVPARQLDPDVKIKRLEHCERHAGHDEAYWKGVIFTDQAASLIQHGNRWQLVPRGEDPDPMPREHPVGGKVHFMGFIGCDLKSELFFLEPGQTWTIDRIKEKLTPFLPQLQGRKWLMDNAPCHAQVKLWLEANGVTVLKHPPYSPDLNPIENLWSLVKFLTRKQKPKSLNELRVALKKAWDEYDIAGFAAFTGSMPRRIEACIEAQGGPTMY